jgi:predicted fused transcriptional regulator/phosphomethylpyrimidine kinase
VAVPACLRLADEVFPRVRAATARRLARAGWSQTRAAAALGISQAMVSKYLSAPVDEDALVARLADDFVAELAAPAAAAASPWCSTLTISQGAGGPALQDLLAAEARLRAALAPQLVPEIGLNLVRALPGATTPAQTLGDPARMVGAGGRLLAPAPPVPGGSRHLATCLLELRRERPHLQALASVRGGAATLGAARRLGWAVADVPVEGRPEGEDRFIAAARAHPAATVLHDAGPPGIEPCLYVAGTDATSVAALLVQLGNVTR